MVQSLTQKFIRQQSIVLPVFSIFVIFSIAIFVAYRALISTPSQTNANAAAQLGLHNILSKLPLSFVPNFKRSDSEFEFSVKNLGGTLYFSPQEVLLNLTPIRSDGAVNDVTPTTLTIQFENANPHLKINGDDRLTGKVNYFIGNDPNRWQTDIPTYGAVTYPDVYPGIDLQYEGNGSDLKSTYFVDAHADPTQIGWQYLGADAVQSDTKTGDLLIYVTRNDVEEPYILREQAPIAWQEIDNEQVRVDVEYAIAQDGKIGFLLGDYDANYPLTIDPLILAYSTYWGGSGFDWAKAIAVDNNGNIYVTGETASSNFPTKNAYDDSLSPSCGIDAFVSKIDTTQSGTSALVYSTYLGASGNCANDSGRGLAVDSSGNVYITGFVQGYDFPVVNAYDDTKDNGTSTSNAAFLTKLNATGNTVLYSTYLGGDDGSLDDIGYGVAVDDTGLAYIIGETDSDDFPAKNAYQNSKNAGQNNPGIRDAFVAVFDTTQSGAASLIYSTYLGGPSNETGIGIVADNAGKAYVTGRTSSTNFPTKNAYQGGYGGGNSDTFVTVLDTTQSGSASLLYSTFLGGSGYDGDTGDIPDNIGGNGTYAGGITVDSSNKLYITGVTRSSDFPTKNAYQSSKNSNADVFVAKLDPTQSGQNSLLYSTYLGGSGDDLGYQIAANSAGAAYIVGSTTSSNFPVLSAYQSSLAGQEDTFIAKLAADGTTLLHSTYFGGSQIDTGMGIAIDDMGGVYFTGLTTSNNLPLQNAYDSTVNGTDGFVAKLSYRTVYLPIILKSN